MDNFENRKFSELITDVLVDHQYTHCFFVAGGNIMHLIESFSARLEMIPVVNEIGAVIGAEYFNEFGKLNGKKAVALVTAGPGITNCVTGIAGAYLESRELLVIGGQVKSQDLKSKDLRQNGIQEIDGVTLLQSITNLSQRIDKPLTYNELSELISIPGSIRKGPVFLEVCLDTQAEMIPELDASNSPDLARLQLAEIRSPSETDVDNLITLIKEAKRPALLVGSGVSLNQIQTISDLTMEMGLPIFSSWNAADRFSHELPNYIGRPNNWGQRHANIVMQQSDLLIAAGTRLGFQQTGFNTDEFAPVGKVVQIEIDKLEIDKGHPKIHLGIVADAGETLVRALQALRSNQFAVDESWISFAQQVKESVPVPDPMNESGPGYVELFSFLNRLSEEFGNADVVIPSSSGGGSTATMQVIKQKGLPQRIITNKGMASMGYGLSGAIGAAVASQNITWLVDGDGGFIQNIQELGVVSQFSLPINIFLISNNGYASIRSTQRNYFDGNYVGCDSNTGLHVPEFEKIAIAYGIDYMIIDFNDPFSNAFLESLTNGRPTIYEIPTDPEQTFYPKIQSRISKEKGMESNPIHRMTPDLPEEEFNLVTPFI
jgi:acetolactate synthase-1/2/3 large subunit